MTVAFILITVVNLAYFLMGNGEDYNTVVISLKIIYIGGCFLPWFTIMCVVDLCRIRIRRIVRTASFILAAAMYFCVLTIDRLPLFYQSMRIEKVGEIWVKNKVYGPFHTVFYFYIIIFMAANLSIIIYCLLKKRQVSRRILTLLIFPTLATMAGYYFSGFFAAAGIEIVPAGYIIAQLTYLLIAHRMSLYDSGGMVIESMVMNGDTGFITLDFKYNYLGSNETAKKIFPELNSLSVDGPVIKAAGLKDTVINWVDHYKEEASEFRTLYTLKDPEGEDKIYLVNVNFLYDGRKKRGYQVFLADDTQNQKYISLLDNYNSELQEEVAAKTERIVEMHDNLILGMATMVESRDNSTGGHIRRTSEGVRLLVEEMQKDDSLKLTASFCKNVIKAAPMHDLGKIAVDDAILRKPGRFTPEEFEEMKSHSSEGARIVHEILKDTDDDEFRVIAENVAQYHHERVDGSGYPEGLKGEEIPFEARIMAIADVYDALVSKRVYKEEYSFEKADRIIMEGMGTQFDPRLKDYYVAARPGLEAYYSAQGG